ncbi:hypothetical protein G6F68_016476 [Rhizopus microsporus]|nr:hypothetical protein G6F68_016476 [Rhizopus microsporus]
MQSPLASASPPRVAQRPRCHPAPARRSARRHADAPSCTGSARRRSRIAHALPGLAWRSRCSGRCAGRGRAAEASPAPTRALRSSLPPARARRT